MGLFDRKNKIGIAQKLGSEAGELAKQQVLISFAPTKYVDNEAFNTPASLYDDLYIRGYCTSFITTLADIESARLGKRWRVSDKQKFVLSAFERLVGAPSASNFIGDIRAASSDKNYSLGSLHANSQLRLQYALGGVDLSLPMFEEAVGLAMGSDLYSVDTAFHKVTLGRYIEKKYLS